MSVSSREPDAPVALHAAAASPKGGGSAGLHRAGFQSPSVTAWVPVRQAYLYLPTRPTAHHHPPPPPRLHRGPSPLDGHTRVSRRPVADRQPHLSPPATPSPCQSSARTPFISLKTKLPLLRTLHPTPIRTRTASPSPGARRTVVSMPAACRDQPPSRRARPRPR